MKTKIFWAGLVMAAAAMCVSCSNKGDGQNQENSDAGIIDERAETIPDSEVLINPTLYEISDTRVIYDSHGALTDDVAFGSDHIGHYRILLPKENGGFEVGYVVKTTRGITLQSNKSFYFYNDLSLKERTNEIINVVGMVRADGSLIPMKITVNGKENQIVFKCQDSDVLTFIPLVRKVETNLTFTVKEMKDYCNKNGIKAKAVPYLQFSD